MIEHLEIAAEVSSLIEGIDPVAPGRRPGRGRGTVERIRASAWPRDDPERDLAAQSLCPSRAVRVSGDPGPLALLLGTPRLALPGGQQWRVRALGIPGCDASRPTGRCGVLGRPRDIPLRGRGEAACSRSRASGRGLERQPADSDPQANLIARLARRDCGRGTVRLRRP